MNLALFFSFLFFFGICGIAAEYPKRLSEKERLILNSDGTRQFYLFYYPGESIQPFHIWKTVQINITFLDGFEDTDYAIYQSSNKTEVESAYEGNRGLINAVFRRWSPTWRPSSYIHPFSPVYVGLETEGSFTIGLKCKNVDYFLAVLFVCGIGLFFTAKRLSRSALAYYTGSTAIGIIGSLAVVVFFAISHGTKAKSRSFGTSRWVVNCALCRLFSMEPCLRHLGRLLPLRRRLFGFRGVNFFRHRLHARSSEWNTNLEFNPMVATDTRSNYGIFWIANSSVVTGFDHYSTGA